ncbi:hypothetical protein ACROYT_G025665 [Oculina patagonica]
MNKLYVEELNKYLDHHKLSLLGKKNDKIRRIMAHVALETNDAERPENKGEKEGNSGDESVDECDSESDDDDEVVAFVDESDSETEVPVNTPGSTRTRAGRLSIPNSRYLDWLAQGGGGGIHFSADCLGDYENLYGPWEGYKKNEPLKKKSSTLPVAYIMNAALYPEIPCLSIVGYCPMLHGASTELSTIYKEFKQLQKMRKCIRQEDAVVTFDLAIYSKAKKIQWSSPDEFKDTVIRLGGFHIALNFLALLGKKYRNSGLEDLNFNRVWSIRGGYNDGHNEREVVQSRG